MQKSGMKMIVVLYMHLDAKGSAAFQSAVLSLPGRQWCSIIVGFFLVHNL